MQNSSDQLSNRDIYVLFLKNSWNLAKVFELKPFTSYRDLQMFQGRLLSRWQAAHRDRKRFEQRYDSWLNMPFTKILCQAPKVPTPRGRPLVDWKSASEKTISRRMKPIREFLEKVDRDLLLKVVEKYFPDVAPNFRVKNADALAFFMMAHLTQSGYQDMRNIDPHCNFPPYDQIQKAKKECYPENVFIGPVVSGVPLQDLCNHTTSRFLDLLKGRTQKFASYVEMGF
eukprot:Pompholyxophrys_punicea_v1_NODE_226_length_2690_cov_5.870588.p2 type:complete len:228 gc:universal NODE_226_length_2690_cov_5.870588:1834-1151(-)